MIRTRNSGNWADRLERHRKPFPGGQRWPPTPAIRRCAVNLDACIQCGLCVRACREVQVNDVIGMAYRNHGAKIVFDFDDPMGEAPASPAANACRPARPGADAGGDARREPDARHLSRPQGGLACARSAASAARSPIRSRTRR
jgi:ferredoxin